jgi:translation initiation factor IF-3
VIRRSTPKQNQYRVRYTANHQIRFPEVRVLTEKGEMLGVMSSREAMEKAMEAEKDLVLITEEAKPPVVKIIDLAKFKYQQQQKASEGRKKAKKQELKEIRFTPFMSEGDFQSRLKKVVDFLQKGDKVRLSLQFKGRQITKKEFGFNQFEKVIAATAEIGKLELEPKIMGKKLIAQLTPTKTK